MSKHWLSLTIAFIFGVALGLLYGWVISPVEYVDTTLDTLHDDYKTDYVLMVAETYSIEQNIENAARHLALMSSTAPVASAVVAFENARNANYTEQDLKLLESLVTALQIWQPDTGDTP